MKNLIKVDPFFPIARDMNSVVNSLLGSGLTDVVGRDHLMHSPAINVREDENNYTLEVAAPGLNKEQFNITLEGRRLTISAEQKDEQKEENNKFKRREFNYSKFSRSFTLPKGTQDEHITANYTNGILNLHIAKVQDETKIKKLIEIA